MDRLNAFTHDMLLEVMLTGSRQWWLKRAQEFERAKPRFGEEFHGRLTLEELRDQWRRLDRIAKACRARAKVCEADSLSEDVQNVLREVAA